MTVNVELLREYKELLQTTNVQKCYQEFVKLFRSIRSELEKCMSEYKFQGSITENGMDYSYFQFTSSDLKEKGLKIAVVFVHANFQFEVWLSGVNRKYQTIYYNQLKERDIPFILTDDPVRRDYILRAPLEESLALTDGNLLVDNIKTVVRQLNVFSEELKKLSA